ncbi:hypothetical protein CsSME_00049035 [Camellia sinensis var. sinensis]
MKSRAVLQTRTNESKSCPSEGSPSEVRAETRLSLGSPSGWTLLLRQLMEAKAIPRSSHWRRRDLFFESLRRRTHSTLVRKILETRTDRSEGCSSEVRVGTHTLLQ